MAFPALPAVDPLCVTHVQRLKHPVQCPLAAWHDYQMNMIGHQAVREHVHPMFLSIFCQPFQIGRTIRIRKKHIFTAIATLRNVMRYPGTNDSRHPWHTENLAHPY